MAAENQPDGPALVRTDAGGVCTLTLDRPQAFNPLSEETLGLLEAHLAEIGEDDAVRVVVLAANGKAFSAGHDLKEMRSKPERAYYVELFNRCGDVMRRIVALPQPVIARVQGVATAAGCQLVATCDLAVASTKSRFAVSGINLGLFCSTPSVALSRNVLRKRAFEMLITGEFIDAQTAADWGLVNRVVEPDELDDAVTALTDSIVSKSPVACAAGKRMFAAQLEKGLADAYSYAADAMAENMMAEDACEGIDAFIEKRKPTWRGR